MLSATLAVASALAVMMVVLGVIFPRTAPSAVQLRLSRFAERPKSLEEIELSQPFAERVVRPAIARVASIMQRFLPKRDVGANEQVLSGVQKRLLLAGSPGNLTANDFRGVTGISAFLMGGTFFLLVGLAGSDMLRVAVLTLVGAGMGYMMPNFWLGSKIRGRQKEIQRAMPDALDILVICVEAGLAFDGALQRLTEKADNALTREFSRAIAEMKMGRPRREALREMVARTEVPDLNTFVSALIQADQLGVSVSRVLTIQAEQMRMIRRQRAEEMAAKAPLKMLFPMIFLIFPSMFIVILGPAVISIAEGGMF